MKIIYNKVFLEHDTGMHPENKKRLLCIDGLKQTEITENGEEYLKLFHTKEYIQKVKNNCKTETQLDPDTFVSKGSYNAAIHAVAATIMASKQHDFALVRPPGHHAHPSNSSGFCLFNNVAIASQKLANEGKKVLIFDIDGHLGDGTVKHFYNSDKVFYWSLHQSHTFPGGGTEEEIGEGKGKGYTINVPLLPGVGDDIYMDAIDLFLPIVKKFKPDVIAVSAGFDAHHSDLLLNLRLSMNIYYKIGKKLRENFKNIFATLEGGYNIEVLPKCIHNFIDGVNGKDMRFKELSTDTQILVREEMEAMLYRISKRLEKYW